MQKAFKMEASNLGWKAAEFRVRQPGRILGCYLIHTPAPKQNIYTNMPNRYLSKLSLDISNNETL